MDAAKKVGWLLLATLSAGCLWASVTFKLNPPEGDTDIGHAEATTALALAVARADKFTVHEGLPHPFEGKEVVQNEILLKRTELLDREWFYVPAQPVPEKDAEKLRRLLANGLFEPWRGVKFCGGFHADYAVSFVADGVTWQVLICFGCHEARILRLPPKARIAQGMAGFRLTTDLTKAGFRELDELFKAYRRQRPPPPEPRTKTKTPVKPPAPPPVPVRL